MGACSGWMTRDSTAFNDFCQKNLHSLFGQGGGYGELHRLLNFVVGIVLLPVRLGPGRSEEDVAMPDQIFPILLVERHGDLREGQLFRLQSADRSSGFVDLFTVEKVSPSKRL